jgi:hypothetical protein
MPPMHEQPGDRENRCWTVMVRPLDCTEATGFVDIANVHVNPAKTTRATEKVALGFAAAGSKPGTTNWDVSPHHATDCPPNEVNFVC